MEKQLYKLVSNARVGLAAVGVALTVSFHLGLIDPGVEKSLQERAGFAQHVLAPIEYYLKCRSDKRKK